MIKAILQTALVSSLVFILGAIGLYNYMPFSIDAIGGEQMLGSTITTINGSDKIKDSREVINTNFANLNSDKLEISDFLATTSLPQVTTLDNLVSVGTITSGTWNADTLTVPYGGTGVTSFSKYHILMGNGTGGLTVVATGTEDQVLSIVGGVPTWSSTAVNETSDYNWTGEHTFSTATTTFNNLVQFTSTTSGDGFTNIEYLTATTSATWVVPEGIIKIRVKVQAGGGNSANATAGGGCSGGGGAGGYAVGVYTVTPNQSITYSVGSAGGNSSFGDFASSTAGASTSAGAEAQNGGAGGTGLGGDINITGQRGAACSADFGGSGGSSILGFGGVGGVNTSGSDTSCTNGAGYGGGAGGDIAASGSGCSGSSGVIIIEY